MIYNPFYETYIRLVKHKALPQALADNNALVSSMLAQMPEEKADYAYAPGKWTLKEVWQHISDTERIMSYRLLRIARNDSTPLPGFDQDIFVANGNAAQLSLQAILDEWKAVRAATNALMANLDPQALQRTGTASGHPISAEALAYIVVGHVEHHLQIIRERYL